MKQLKAFLKTKIGRTVLVCGIALLVVAANLLACLGVVNGAFYPDLTPEALYTVTPALHDICDKLSGEIKMTLCDDPDKLLDNVESRYVYILAQQLAKEHDQITVETVNFSLKNTIPLKVENIIVPPLIIGKVTDAPKALGCVAIAMK